MFLNLNYARESMTHQIQQNEQESKDGWAMYPSVSVIMPVQNEADFIHNSLGAVLSQDYPSDRMEVVVVDGMSADQTCDIIRQLIAECANVKVRLLENERRITPVSLNIATRQAEGCIIIRVDGHCILAPDYVRKCVEHIQDDRVDCVGGPMQTIGNGYISELISIVMSSKFGVGNSSFRTEKGLTKLVDTVPFPAYTRQIVELAGLYDEEMVRNQDDEYNYRIRKIGGKILLAEDVRSKYYSRSSLLKLAKQYFQYGVYKVRVLQKHPLQMRNRQFVPPVFTLALTASLGLLLLGWIGWPLALVLGAYMLANLSASFYTAVRYGWRYLPILPFAFAIVHLSYGSGFLIGLVKFKGRWGDKTGMTSGIHPWSGEALG
jgi:succinoglycan biosynthesis protein ExoA